jgi:hypothetical protein
MLKATWTQWIKAKRGGLRFFSHGFNQPLIRRIEQRDGSILVEAHVKVTRVQVTILDGQGQIIRKGEGIRTDRNCWEFSTHVKGNILIAEAWDLAGNVAKLVV